MSKSILFSAALLFLLFGLPVVQANNDYSSFEARMEQLEAELASLRSTVNSSGGTLSACDSCDDCNYFNYSGWIVGFETPVLKAYDSIGVQGALGTDLSYDWEITPRIWLGYTTPSGIGFRMRYWDFDHSATAATSATTTDSHNIDTYVFDLEVTNWFELGHSWSALVSGGARYVEFERTQMNFVNATGAATARHQFASSNLGGTLAAELYYHVSERFSLFGMGRSSVVFGDETERFGPAFALVDQETDNVRFMWESQLGGQWQTSLDRADVFVRLAAEVQYWNNFVGEPFFDGGEAIGFSGFTTAVGFAR